MRYNSEHSLYEQIARYLQLQYPDVVYRFDLASDLKLTPGQAAKHKRLHPERGYPDLFIAESSTNIWNSPVREWGLHFGLYIEIKKDGEKLNKKDGSWRTSHIAEQAGMLENLRARGYRAEFGVGFDECKQIIDEYLRR